jgi:hypothetical protein
VHAWRALTCQASNRLAPAPDPHRRGQGRQPACEGRSNHGLSDRRSRCAQPPPAPRARQDHVAGDDAPLPSGASNQGRGEPRVIPGQLRLSPCGGSARTLAQRTPAVRGKHRLIVLARNVHPDEPPAPRLLARKQKALLAEQRRHDSDQRRRSRQLATGRAICSKWTRPERGIATARQAWVFRLLQASLEALGVTRSRGVRGSRRGSAA